MNALNIAKMMNPFRCCKQRFNYMITLKGQYGKDLTWTPNGKYLFHFFDTHGFPAGLTIEEIRKKIEAPMTQAEVDYYNKTIKERNEDH